MTTNDQVYIEAILNGDANAFAVFVDRYKDLVFTLALRMMKQVFNILYMKNLKI